ncbi:hypothetical protein PNOK_0131000 [Pyrrhoderma noxium]|uniref:Uncharacterized protein n=1 Tax=Pyrrhoderma noxium TaxID=2282107 RepID=A0A286UXG7_9AGAM|nr:hypothetical protein PNOK_0131000 [Pyrrhoderma noxium]
MNSSDPSALHPSLRRPLTLAPSQKGKRINEEGRRMLAKFLGPYLKKRQTLSCHERQELINKLLNDLKAVGNEWVTRNTFNYYVNREVKKMHWSRTNINLSVPDSLLNSGLYVHEESVISDAREEEELLWGNIDQKIRLSLRRMMLKSQLKRFHPSSLAQIFDVPDTIMSEYINWLKLENVDHPSISIELREQLDKLLRARPGASDDHQRIWASRLGIPEKDVLAYVQMQREAQRKNINHGLPSPVSPLEASLSPVDEIVGPRRQSISSARSSAYQIENNAGSSFASASETPNFAFQQEHSSFKQYTEKNLLVQPKKKINGPAKDVDSSSSDQLIKFKFETCSPSDELNVDPPRQYEPEDEEMRKAKGESNMNNEEVSPNNMLCTPSAPKTLSELVSWMEKNGEPIDFILELSKKLSVEKVN